MSFLGGSLTLIVLYALVQPYGADRASQAGKVAQGLLQRVMSSTVAGVPNRGGATTAKPSATTTGPAPTVNTGTTPPPVGPFISL